MKLNKTRFLLIFATLMTVCFAAGCTAQWVGAIGNLLPTLQTVVAAIVSFVLALEGKTLTPQLSAAMQRITDSVKAGVDEVSSLVATYKATPTNSVIQNIQAVLNKVVRDFGNLLDIAHVSDPGTTSKLTELVGLGVTAVQAILGLLPIVAMLGPKATKAQLERADEHAAQALTMSNTMIKREYQAIKETTTGKAEVDAALAAMPSL